MLGRIKQLTYEKRKEGLDVIDLNMGNPSDPTPQVVVDKLREASQDIRNQRYSASAGIYNLRREISRKYEDVLTFKYTGPWPPYNFVNIKLKLEKAN